jgi:FKBP-type peptidyl-prolyl cis-trans isomerase
MKKKTFAILGMAALLMTACNDYKGYQKTDSGLRYRFHTQNEDENAKKAEIGDVLSLSLEIRTDDDSVLQSVPEIQAMLQAPKFQGDIFEGLQMMREGDSATFIIPAKAYFNTYNYGQIPDFVGEKSVLFITACIHSIQSFEEYRTLKMQEMQEKEKAQLSQYLQEHNITVEPTASGLYYIETKAGKGATPTKGSQCTVHYRGTLFDGTQFDASYDRNEPFTFQLGMGQVIAGWDEGIALMKKGGKATLLLPSAISYGERGAGDMIPPFTPLIFEVELLDFK